MNFLFDRARKHPIAASLSVLAVIAITKAAYDYASQTPAKISHDKHPTPSPKQKETRMYAIVENKFIAIDSNKRKEEIVQLILNFVADPSQGQDINDAMQAIINDKEKYSNRMFANGINLIGDQSELIKQMNVFKDLTNPMISAVKKESEEITQKFAKLLNPN